MKTVNQRVEDWRRQLLDLTKRNALLNFRISTGRPTSIALIEPGADAIFSALMAGESLEIVAETEDPGDFADDLVAEGEPAEEPEAPVRGELPPLGPGQVRSSLTAERTVKVGLRLSIRARGSEQEQGVTTLFVAFGLLRWQRPNESDWLHSPLVLLPVRITEHRKRESWVIAANGDDPEFNQTLAETLRQTFGIDLTPELGEEPNLDAIFSAVRSAVSGRSGWEVREEAHLGIFQFHKLRMFADLGEHVDVAAGHPIIKALATDGAVIGALPSGVPVMDDLDWAVPPTELFTVLDADAAQLHAIAAVKRDGNVIVMGPPGTGKSQTIANIIAEAMAAGKTVLFVSEKAAAIEVVHRRLQQAGLGDLCLVLHSLSAGKREIIADLGRRLEAIAAGRSDSGGDHTLIELQKVRAKLADHSRALHARRLPLGRSIYWVYSRLAALGEAPLLRFVMPGVADLTVEQLEDEFEIVASAARHLAVLAQGERHLWAGIAPDAVNVATREGLRQAIQEAAARTERLQVGSAALASDIGLPRPEIAAAVVELVAVARAGERAAGIPVEWLSRAAISRKVALAREARERAVRLNEFRIGVSEAFEQVPEDLDISAAIALYELPILIRVFLPRWWSFRSLIGQHGGADWVGDAVRAVGNLQAVTGLREHEKWFESQTFALTQEFGAGAPIRDVAFWDAANAELARASSIVEVLPGEEMSPQMARWFANHGQTSDARIGEIERDAAALARELTTISGYYQPGRATVAGRPLSDATLPALRGWLDLLGREFAALDEWVQAGQTRAALKASGLEPVVAELIERDIAKDQWGPTYKRRRLTDWLGAQLMREPGLAQFAGSDHAELVERFQSLDRRSIKRGAQRVLARADAARGRVASSFSGEPGILRHEAKKTRRHKPLRKLFAETPTLLPVLKPCVMMSPLTVAQYLPADRYTFDLVIFDEASQVRPHDAIGAIMRGRQLVVAGDNRQLPPTSFFDRAIGDSEEEAEGQDIRELESILDALGAKGMEPIPLLWHYRSRHESLIAWSNFHIYDGQLITTPSALTAADHDHGVRFEFVDGGVYEQLRDRALGASVRVNRNEADRVVDLIRLHARKHPSRSLGVVALGSNQRDLILERLKDARELDTTLDEFCRAESSEAFFVKALEEVQGDERDTMIVSVGFGRNRNGVLSHNFGPINQDGGERRLNVLVTRAKEQLILVASIRGADIDESKVSKAGPKLLKNYLEYAENGSIALAQFIKSVDSETESVFEEQVARALERRGWTVHTQIGVSKYRIDLGIVDPKQPGRYLLAVECDGATYHSLKTARDRDRLRQDVLEGLGWEFHRVWSTEWMKDPQRELSRIEQRLAELMSGERMTRTKPEPVELDPLPRPEDARPNSAEPLSPEPAPTLPQLTPYRVATVPVTGQGNLTDASLPSLVRAVEAVVQVEGPIHEELLMRRISSAWGHSRAGSRIVDALQYAIDEAARQGKLRRDGAVLWPVNAGSLVPRGAAPDGTIREIGHIPNEERAAVMRLLLEASLSFPPDELVQQTARLLGYARTGSEINRELRATLEGAVASGAFEQVAGRIRLSR
jgi:very-short-patch-repair endonuclease